LGALFVDDARGDLFFPAFVAPLFFEFPLDLFVLALALWTGTGGHGVLLFQNGLSGYFLALRLYAKFRTVRNRKSTKDGYSPLKKGPTMTAPNSSRRALVGAAATGLMGAALAPARAQSGNASGADMPPKDPVTAYPAPPFPKQQQPWPGLTSKMNPRPDHGETSYKADRTVGMGARYRSEGPLAGLRSKWPVA
jgi:hypothetical protein